MVGDDEPEAVRQLRREVARWVSEAWDPALTVREWWARLVESGWGFPHWPVEWFGRGLDNRAVGVIHEELAAANVVGPPNGVGTAMGANVLFAYGTDDQKRRWLPALARGEESWCQFFSEPGAGSDLASVQTRAVRDGDQWVVNGTKVWNSGTLTADRGLLVARTDADVPKHRGISFFVIDLDQPGIDVRPIRQMNGRREFNETFFTDAVVAHDALVGTLNAGFGIAMLTLGSERAEYAGGGEHTLIEVAPGRKGGVLNRLVGDVMAEVQHQEVGDGNTPPIHTTDHLVDLARRHGRAADPVIRQHIAGVHALAEALRFTGLRGRAAAEAGRAPGPESSILYLGGVQVIRRFRDLVAEISGPAATLWGPDAPDRGEAAMTIATAPCHGIQGGSEQIQRNIIGERLLGLPKEPSVDREIPFRDVKVGTQRA
jgi:alkylation response protein AidB-like acyl-CoA dehydrogenase